MSTKSVVVVHHDESWGDSFRLVRTELERAFGSASVAIHHIGSTSIPGMRAKPVIDVLVETSDLHLIDERTSALEAIGFQARGEYGIQGRRYFSRSAAEEGLAVHVHAFRRGDPQIARHLGFRDYLREHPREAGAYSALKAELAAAHPTDRDAYQAGKAAFIDTVHMRAEKWAHSAASALAHVR